MPGDMRAFRKLTLTICWAICRITPDADIYPAQLLAAIRTYEWLTVGNHLKTQFSELSP
jgi:hypothetical protein